MTKTLISFHGDPAIKEKYLSRLHAHRAADEIIQGIGYEKYSGSGKGCAVGCTLNKYDHKAYETELGIPLILAKLEDRIFEGLSVRDSKDFPVNFLSAITPGKDLSNVFRHFFIWLLSDTSDGVIKYAKNDSTRKAIQDVSDLLNESLLHKVTTKQFLVVRAAAYSAYAAAAYAAAYAAASAAYAAAASASAYADAAAYAAAYASSAAADAYAAAYAAAAADADAAAYAAASAYASAYASAADADAAYASSAYAAAAARTIMYKKMADKLIELLKTA